LEKAREMEQCMVEWGSVREKGKRIRGCMFDFWLFFLLLKKLKKKKNGKS